MTADDQSSAADQASETKRATRPLWRRITGSPLFHVVAAFVVAGLVLSFVVKPYQVPSESMLETLQVGDLVLVNRTAYPGSSIDDGPEVGDVVVFDADESWGAYPQPSSNPIKRVARSVLSATGFGPTGWNTLAKRVVAGPGQTVSCCDQNGALLVDGQPLDEPYISGDLEFIPGALDCETTPASKRCLPEVRVPDDAYLVLGDNRGNSADSAIKCRTQEPTAECYRWARRDQLVGQVVAVIWPPADWAGQP